MKILYNVISILPDKELKSKAVIFDEKIIDIVDVSSVELSKFDETIDGNGYYLSPGFIDLHTHGCAGFDVMDGTSEGINTISKGLATTGVTSFLPTTMTERLDRIYNALTNIRENTNKVEGAAILGCHLEGPFISKTYKGAHDERYILKPDFDLTEDYKDIIKIVTLAPEEDDNFTFISRCVENGITASIGHSNSDYEIAMDAISRGVKHATHTFNAMPPLNHRKPGVLGAVMNSNVSCEIIADKVHTHPSIFNILLKAKGIDNLILITDSIKASLMKDGTYDLGGQEVFVKDNQARLKDGTLAGSVLTMNKAVKNFMEHTNITLHEAVDMATINPARQLNLAGKKGSIEKGKDADIILFDENLDIKCTFVGGKMVFRTKE